MKFHRGLLVAFSGVDGSALPRRRPRKADLRRVGLSNPTGPEDFLELKLLFAVED